MKVYISNAFSIKMIDRERRCIKFFPCTLEEVRKYAASVWLSSAVGHQSTAEVYSRLLGVEVPCQRVEIKLRGDDIIFLGEIKGGRLPEGIVLSEIDPSQIEWWRIQLLQVSDV